MTEARHGQTMPCFNDADSITLLQEHVEKLGRELQTHVAKVSEMQATVELGTTSEVWMYGNVGIQWNTHFTKFQHAFIYMISRTLSASAIAEQHDCSVCHSEDSV